MMSVASEGLVAFLLSVMRKVTGLSQEELGSRTRFDDIGLQSLAVVAFTRRLANDFTKLSQTFLYDCADISEVAYYLERRYPAEVIAQVLARNAGRASALPSGSLTAPSAAPSRLTATSPGDWPDLVPIDESDVQSDALDSDRMGDADVTGAIAVIGMHGRFPGAADLETFWENLVSGVDSVGEIPPSRWSLEDFFEDSKGERRPGRSYAKWGAFLNEVDCFDTQFFGIAPREAALMDPQERLCLESAWHAMEDAALLGERADDIKSADGYEIGVFIGLTTNTYALLGPDRWRQGAADIPTSMPWSASNRISYCLNLSGPSFTVDTACSSGLVAVHLACGSLLRHECDAALAGAVNLYLHPAKYVALCQQQMLSPTGRCHSFGAAADGFVPGEGVGTIVLRRLQDALDKGDRILAVIKGTAINHNGRSNGYTVPKSRAQARLVRAALQKAKVPAGRIGFVEAHGTGTKLGDPIEVAGLTEVLGSGDGSPSCAIGSVKTNIGHLESAAGIASIIKTILQLQHAQIVPSLHAEHLNPALDLDATRFFVPQEPQPWPKPADGQLRAAGISSFGAGGTNGHVILEEAPARLLQDGVSGLFAFPLTARTAGQLKQIARGVLTMFESADFDSSERALRQFAYTLQTGLRHFEHRLCLVGADRNALIQQLRAFLNTASTGAGLGKSGPPYAGIASGAEGDSLDTTAWTADAVAKAFAGGGAVLWSQHWSGLKPIPVRPPLYPFLRERHWLKSLPGIPEANGGATDSGTHILPCDAKAVDIVEISRNDSVLADHRIAGRPILPGAALLAYALDGARAATGSQLIELCNIAWRRPLMIRDDAASLTFALHWTRRGEGTHLEVKHTDGDGVRPYFEAEAGRAMQPDDPQQPSLAQARQRCRDVIDVDACYSRFATLDMDYGPRFRTLRSAVSGNGAFLAYLECQTPAHAGSQILSIDPALLDGAFHAAIALVARHGVPIAPLVPASLGRLKLFGSPGDRLWSYGIELPPIGADEHRFDVYLYNPDGTLVAALKDLCFRAARGFRKPVPAPASLHLFQPQWRPCSLEHAGERTPAAVVFDADGLLVQSLRRMWPAEANSLRLVAAGETFEVIGEQEVRWNPKAPSHGSLLWRTLVATDGVISTFVFNIRSGGHGDADALDESGDVLYVVETLRLLAKSAAGRSMRIVILVHGRAGAVAAAALGGLLRSVSLEIPALSATLATIVEDADAPMVALREICAPPAAGVTERRWSRSGVEHLDVVKTPDAVAATIPGPAARISFKPDDCFVVTGGAGAVGRVLIEDLYRRGVRKIGLIGRSDSTQEIDAFVAGLAQRGCTAHYIAADCSDRQSLSAALFRLKRLVGPPTGILHCAGTLKDGFFVRQSADDLIQSARAKIDGARWLDELTAEEPLRWFITCSGLAGIGGNVGQSHYAFANRWLDGFAEWRDQLAVRGKRSGRSLSIVWPLWKTSHGMQGSEALSRRIAHLGLELITPEDGAALFATCMMQSAPVVLPVKGDLEKITKFLSRARAEPLLAVQPVTSHPTTAIPAVPVHEDAPMEHVDDSAAIEAALIVKLREALGTVTGTTPGKIDPDAAMEVFGLDSILITELSGLLEVQFPALSKTVAYEVRNLRGLAQLIMREHLQEARALLPGDKAPASRPDGKAETPPRYAAPPELSPDVRNERDTFQARDGDIAIIGLAGQYPNSDSLEAFWDHLACGHDLVREIPPRWPAAAKARSTSSLGRDVYARWGSFLDDFDKFDPLFFGISPRDAERIDPQERLFLQAAWHAVEDAGYTPEQLSGPRGRDRKRVGVFAGVMYGEYQFYGASSGPETAVPLTNSSYASIANRVSFCLDLDGPSLAIDSMCSSSLTAIHLACELMRAKNCDLAIAGGVNLSLHPYKYRLLSELGFASTDGKCRSFGEGGDGYVPGEGVGAVLLKPLASARQDGDHIYAVIRGSDIGHGGRSSGYTVPSGEAQEDVIRRAMARSGVAPDRLSYIEAHGTGTSLGDPIEIRGLSRALGDRLAVGQRCPVGSVKSNIGHLEAAAGMAAVTKVLLQLKHRQIAPSIHSERLNGNIDFSKSPFYVQQTLSDWPARNGQPRVAAISSFGAGGSNAHLVVEEYPVIAAQRLLKTAPNVFVFSGRTRAALVRNLILFKSHLDTERGTDGLRLGREQFSVEEVAATLFHGRRWLHHRCAIVASDFAELRDRLTACIAAVPPDHASSASPMIENGTVIFGEVDPAAPALQGGGSHVPAERARAWVEGRMARSADMPKELRRVPLPGYAFDKQSYWIRHETVAPVAIVADGAASGPSVAAGSRISAPSAGRAVPVSEWPQQPSARSVLTPEIILKKVDLGELDMATAQQLLESLIAREAAE